MVDRVERTKKPSSGARALPRDFVVVLEALRGDFRVFGDALQSFREDVDARFDRVETDIGLLKSAVVETTRELKRIGTALDRKVDRDEVEA